MYFIIYFAVKRKIILIDLVIKAFVYLPTRNYIKDYLREIL